MNKATVYIVALGILCLGAGVALGMLVEKEYNKRSFPHNMFMNAARHEGKGMHSTMGRKEHSAQSQRGGDMKERFGFGGKEGMADRICDRMVEKLDLNAQQQEQVKGILEQSKQKIEQAKDGFKQSLTQIREEGNSQISTILNSEQQQKFEQMNSLRDKKNRPEMGPKCGMTPEPEQPLEE